MHGWQKLFELGLSGTTQLFVTLGAPMPELTGPLVGLLELIGGAALLLGLGTRWVTPLLALDMLAAILIVKLPHGFFAPMGYEHEFVLLGSAVTLAFTGSGAFALDRLVGHSSERAALVR
jgi:putative oxidoreductase